MGMAAVRPLKTASGNWDRLCGSGCTRDNHQGHDEPSGPALQLDRVSAGPSGLFGRFCPSHVDESAFRLGKVGSVYVETDEWDRNPVSSQG